MASFEYYVNNQYTDSTSAIYKLYTYAYKMHIFLFGVCVIISVRTCHQLIPVTNKNHTKALSLRYCDSRWRFHDLQYRRAFVIEFSAWFLMCKLCPRPSNLTTVPTVYVSVCLWGVKFLYAKKNTSRWIWVSNTNLFLITDRIKDRKILKCHDTFSPNLACGQCSLEDPIWVYMARIGTAWWTYIHTSVCLYKDISMCK